MQEIYKECLNCIHLKPSTIILNNIAGTFE